MSAKTSVSALSGKDLKVKIGRGGRVILEGNNYEYNYGNHNNRIEEIVIDESNKIAFFESHYYYEFTWITTQSYC